MKRAFHANAVNEAGDRWSFGFFHENWNGIQQAAEDAMAELVADNPLHQKYGPWKATRIDVGTP